MQNLTDVRDRTSEFFSTVAAIQRQNQSNNQLGNSIERPHSTQPGLPLRSNGTTLYPVQSNGSNPLNHSHSTPDSMNTLLSNHQPIPQQVTQQNDQSAFSKAAHQIGLQITNLTGNLDRLSQLVHQQSIFADPTEEIDRLTTQVKSELRSIESDLTQLDAFVQQRIDRANHSSQSALESDSKQARNHSAVIVDSLKKNLGQSTKSFINLLEKRTKNLKVQNSRRKEFENVSTLRPRTSNRFASLLEDQDEKTHLLTQDNEPVTADDDQYYQQSQSQAMMLESLQSSTDSYHQSRAEAVETIESTINELGSMYTRLTSLIQMQDETILRIDANIDDTLHHVEAGHSELLKYFDNISSNRMLILKVFAILIAFIVFFMLFVA